MRHYTFHEKGRIVTATDYGHYALQVNFTDLEPFITQLAILNSHVAHLNESEVPHAATFAALIQDEYQRLSNLYDNVCLFFAPARKRETRQPTPEIPSSTSPRPSTTTRSSGYDNNIDVIPPTETNISEEIIHDLNPSRREKRFIAVLAALLTGLVAGGTVFGLFDQMQINGLASALSDTNTRQAALIHVLNAQSEIIKANRHAILRVRSSLKFALQELRKNHNDIHYATLTLYANHISTAVRNALETYVDVIEAANAKRFHFGLLSHDQAAQALQAIADMSNPRGLHPLISEPHQLLQLPVSVALQSSGFVLFCHVPLARAEHFLKFYKYKPFPVSLTPRSQMIIRPPKNMLAIADDGSHVELAEDDLTDCIELGPQLTSCPHLNLLNTPSNPSCLSSLFTADYNVSVTLCKLFVSPAEDHVMYLSANKFLTYSIEPSTYQIQCYNGSSTTQQLLPLSVIEVENNCIAILPKFRLSPLSDLYVQDHHNSYLWFYPLDKLLSNDQIEAVDLVMDKLNDQQITEVNFDKLRDLTDEEIHPHLKYSFSMATLAAGLSFLAVSLLMCLCYCFYRSKGDYLRISQLHPPPNSAGLQININPDGNLGTSEVRKSSLEATQAS